MRLKQKIQIRLRQRLAVYNQSLFKTPCTPTSSDVSSTTDESNGSSPKYTPPRGLKSKVKLENIHVKTEVKIEEDLCLSKENTFTRATMSPRSDEDYSMIKKNSGIRSPLKSDSEDSYNKGEYKTHPTKNIALNYGKAMVTFATSHLAIPYIQLFLKDTDLDFQGFVIFIKENKKVVTSMAGIREMIMVNKRKDNEIVSGYKRTFQKVCEVFLKYFSANWILNSKLTHRMVYLKWRSKMLRRVQHPEIFTHMGGSHSV